MKDGFVIYTKYEEQIKMLTDTQAGILLRALIAHQRGAEVPKMDAVTSMAFAFIRQQIDAENQKYDSICAIRKEAGKKGGRPSKSLINQGDKPKKANGYFGFEEKANESKITKRFLEETTFPLKKTTKEKAEQKEKNKKTNTPFVQEETPLNPPKVGTAQKNFFKVYCQFKKAANGSYPAIDFERLTEEFAKSASLRKTFSWQLILDSYDSILAGNFRDKVDEQAEGRALMADRERHYTAIRNEEERKVEAIVKKLMTYPRYAEIDKRLRSIEIDAAKAEVKGDKLKRAKLEQERNRLRMERNNILANNGLEEEDIIVKRRCQDCNDTGWLEDGTMCTCYKGG